MLIKKIKNNSVDLHVINKVLFISKKFADLCLISLDFFSKSVRKERFCDVIVSLL